MFNSDNSTLYNKNLDQFSNPIGKNWHYWMYIIKDGRPVILGFRNSEEEAYSYIRSHSPEYEPKVIALDTVDIHKASSKIKSRVLEETKSIDQATQKMILNQSEQMKKKKKKVVDNEWAEY